MRIKVVNASTSVSNDDVQKMTQAVDAQLYYHACPAYNRRPDRVIYAKSRAEQHNDDAVVIIADHARQAEDLGWHSLNDTPYAFVYAGLVLANGGNTLTTQVSVATVLSHRCLEVALTPTPPMLVDAGNGWLWSYEVCDPVEGDSYPILDEKVTVSNFVLPAFWVANTDQRVDFMGNLSSSFSVGEHGFASRMRSGNRSDLLGDKWLSWYDSAKG